jgi:hypothetical protein
VDRVGIRLVFKASHLAYLFVLLGMLSWRWVPWSLEIHAAFCAAAYSLVVGVAGVASTSKILALIPANNKALSTAFTITLLSGATAFSGMIVSRVIAFESFFKTSVISSYDLILLVFVFAIALLFLFSFVHLKKKKQ